MREIKVLHIDDKTSWAGGQSQLFQLYRKQLESDDIRPYLAVRKKSALVERLGSSQGIYHFNLRSELDPLAVISLRSIIKKVQPDIIQCHTPHSIYPAFIASKFTKEKPKLIIVRRVDNPLKSCIKYKITSDCIVAVSENVLGMMKKSGYNRDNVVVIRDGVDKADVFTKGSTQVNHYHKYAMEGKIRIGSISTLIYHKGIDILINAFSLLSSEKDNLHLFIAGDGDQKKSLEKLARDLNIDKHVTFLGFVGKPYGFINFLDIIIFPSRTEGLCSSILDALVMNKRIIASESGGIPEIINDGINGLLFCPGDIHDLSRKISVLLEKPVLPGGDGPEGSEKLPWWADISYNAEKYALLYRQILKK